jgi:hypothetical protein
MDINIAFSRQLLKTKHEELAQLLPGVRLIKDASVINTTSSTVRKHWLFELVIDDRYWSADVTADNAYEARCKGWDQFSWRCAELLGFFAQELAGTR